MQKGTKPKLIRSFTCTRCKEVKEQTTCGVLATLCKDCKNKKVPCSCGCGGFVRASHNNSQFISGHNIALLTEEELKTRNKKAAVTRIKNGNHIPSEKVKKKISSSVTERYKDPKYMEAFLEANRSRRPFNDKARANMSAAKKP